MSADGPRLWDRMRALAPQRANGAELIEKADALEAATAGYYGEPQTVTAPSFLGAYARARRAWCEASGEPLV